METIIFTSVILILIVTYGFDLWLSILNYGYRNEEIPIEVIDVYDVESYQKWHRYNMENYRLSLLSKTVHFIIILIILLSNIFPLVNRLTENITNSVYIKTLLFLAFYYIFDFILGLFFSYYKQFVIEEKYGFNKSTKMTFTIDQIKSFILTLIFGGGFIILLTMLFYNVGNLFYIYAWCSIIAITLFINMFYVRLIIPIFNKLSPMEDGEFKDKIVSFATKVGYEVSKISIMNASKRSTKLNAFFTGFGKFKQIVLYDTLLEKMNDEQIISVLAHEIGHSKHKHLVKNIFIMLASVSIFLAVLLVSVKSETLAKAFGFDGAHFGFGLIIFSILISPISMIMSTYTNFISRKFEYEADAFAAINGYKMDMEESLKILARENFANLTPHPLYVAMNYSHPPIALRIRAIRSIK